MPTILNITFSDNSSVAFSADGNSITTTDASGVAKVFTTTAPVVAPTDTEVDIVKSDGTVVKLQIPTA